MIARHFAVFAGEHHDCVIGDARLVQRIGDFGYHSVNQRDVGEVVRAQRAPAEFGGEVLPACGVVGHIRVLRRIAAVVHVLGVVIAAHSVVHRSTVRPLQERRADGKRGGIVHIVQRPVVGRMRFECADIQREGLVGVAFDEIGGAVAQEGRHLKLFGQASARGGRKDELAGHALQVRLKAVVD